MELYVLVRCDECGVMGNAHIYGIVTPAPRDDSWGGEDPYLNVSVPDDWTEEHIYGRSTHAYCAKCTEKRKEE